MGAVIAMCGLLVAGNVTVAESSPAATSDQRAPEELVLSPSEPTREHPGWIDQTPPAETSHWYGLQLIPSDLVAGALLALGGALLVVEADLEVFGCISSPSCQFHDPLDVVPITAVGLGMWMLLPPLIHALHGRFGTAAASFGLRATVPLAFVLSGNPIVALVVYGAVLLIDDIGLAWETVPSVGPEPGIGASFSAHW